MQNSRTDGDIESTYISSQVCDLNDFILQDYIGSGSFGKVYKVKEKKTGRILAAKISIQALYEDSTEEIQNLSREVNIISKLNHPSVLKFVAFSPFNFKNKRKPVIITEFASNHSLEKLISDERESKSNPNWNETRKLIIIYGISNVIFTQK